MPVTPGAITGNFKVLDPRGTENEPLFRSPPWNGMLSLEDVSLVPFARLVERLKRPESDEADGNRFCWTLFCRASFAVSPGALPPGTGATGGAATARIVGGAMALGGRCEPC